MTMHPSWKAVLAEEFKKDYFVRLHAFVQNERSSTHVFPPPNQVLTAFQETPFEDVRVVILGQDPYHGAEQAHGLSFSVLPGTKVPPSLVNIFKELQSDLGLPKPTNGCLLPWARQGVLLLNSVLTVRAHQPGSHANQGWETFTDRVIEILSAREEPVIFILWGKYARDKARLIDAEKHLILESAHPSPMSASYGFFGSKPFSKANETLESLGQDPIDWSL